MSFSRWCIARANQHHQQTGATSGISTTVTTNSTAQTKEITTTVQLPTQQIQHLVPTFTLPNQPVSPLTTGQSSDQGSANTQQVTSPQESQSVYTKQQLYEYALQVINQDRASRGLPPVNLDNNQAAQAQADDMLRSHQLSHWMSRVKSHTCHIQDSEDLEMLYKMQRHKGMRIFHNVVIQMLSASESTQNKPLSRQSMA